MRLERGSLKRGAALGVLIASLTLVSACGGGKGPEVYGDKRGGIWPFGRGSSGPAQTEIGVNGYLWRASLDALNFMPLASADPYGGVIITDWYTAPEAPNERFKTTVYILDTRLRADGLNVTVFKQVRDASGAWADAPASAQTESDLENAILTRARQLRLANLNG